MKKMDMQKDDAAYKKAFDASGDAATPSKKMSVTRNVPTVNQSKPQGTGSKAAMSSKKGKC